MKAKKSPLVLNNFILLNNTYKFIQATEDINIIEIMEQYSIDIDFVIQPVNEEFYQLFTKIGINNIDQPLPGYKQFIEGACIFSFDKEAGLSEMDKGTLLHISGLNISINSLRNIVAVITANGPFGKYTLPAIDVNQLLADKKQIIEKQKLSK